MAGRFCSGCYSNFLMPSIRDLFPRLLQDKTLQGTIVENGLITATTALERLKDYGPAAALLEIFTTEATSTQYTVFMPSDAAWADIGDIAAFTNQGIYEVSCQPTTLIDALRNFLCLGF
jgi:hypothetical protein